MKIQLSIFLCLFPILLNCQIEFTNLFSTDMKEGISCYRIPALLAAKNGDLIALIDERVPSCGDLKWSEDINIVMRRSEDSGETWSEIQTIIDYPLGESASDASMILDEMTGEIFLFFNYMNLKREPNIYYLKLMTSRDNGKTWSAPIDITEQITKPEWKPDFKFITSGRGIQTSKGTLLHTLVNLENGLHVFGSNDHGKTWFLLETPLKPGDESKIVELTNGNWMVNSRVAKLGGRFIHISEDFGKTWKSHLDTTLTDPACNASLIRYTFSENEEQKNCLLFSNAHSKNSRENLTIRISYDEGKTWSKGKTIYVGKAAYSSMTVLKNGDIGLFFEKDNYRENVFVRLSFEWLRD